MGITDVQYVYRKSRQQFGRQCVFEATGPLAVENIEPNPELRSEFIRKNELHVASQNCRQYAVHEAQTENVGLTERGMLHREGGWPREVNFKEEEATSRYRKRVMRTEGWAPALKNLMTPMERVVKQNNALNIHENYFDEMIPSRLVSPHASKVINTYTDPGLNGGPISNISWSRRGSKMIVTHCLVDFDFGKPSSRLSPASYLWAIENPAHPLLTLKPDIPSVTIEFNPRHSSLLVSGQMTGQVAFWDLRTAALPIAESHRPYSHSDPASIVTWIDTKTHCEFVSASSDGSMKWWDIRSVKKPTGILSMDLNRPSENGMATPVGISSLNYSSATKFIIGLENGIAINVSSRSKSDAEKLSARFSCHSGPVISVNRSPFIPKIFITVGDWTTRVWAEDTKESCLASTDYRSKTNMLTGGCWSNSRVSVFYAISSTGEFEVWDLMSGLNKPVEMLKLGKDHLTRIKPHENGRFIAIGSRIGSVYLVELSEGLTTSRKTDKAVLTAYLDNCRHHEKSVDNRLKEVKLSRRLNRRDSESPEESAARKDERTNTRQTDHDGAKVETDANLQKSGKKMENTSSVPLDPDLIEPEKEYFALVQEELKRYGNLASDNGAEGLPESRAKDHRDHDHHGHHKPLRHNRNSYKNKKAHEKYKKPEEPEPSFAVSDSPGGSEIRDEVIKPSLLSPRLTKSRKRSPKLCVAGSPRRVCRPEICCRDVVKDSSNKGKKLTVKGPRNTAAFFSTGQKFPYPFASINPVAKVEGSASAKSEKYRSARTADLKDVLAEANAQILKRVKARPSAILLELLLANERTDQEADQIRSDAKKERSEGTDEAKVVQFAEEAEKIAPKDGNEPDKTEDVKPAKMKQQKMSPNEATSCFIPRRALTALQVARTEVFKPKLTARQEYPQSQKESLEESMYPGSSAFPPLPRIILPKLLDRPQDPSVVRRQQSTGIGKKTKGKVKTGVNRAEKSISPNK